MKRRLTVHQLTNIGYCVHIYILTRVASGDINPYMNISIALPILSLKSLYRTRGVVKVSSTPVNSMETVDAMHLAIGVPLVIINALAFFILKRSTLLPFQIQLLSMNLCLADFLSSVHIMMPKSAFGSKGTKSFLVHLFTQVSFLIITAFNLDRFLAFQQPMNYYNILSKRLVYIVCMVLWTFAVVLSYIRDCLMSSDRVCNRYSQMDITNPVNYIFCFIFLLNLLMIGYNLYFIRFKLGPVDFYKTRSATNTFRKVSVMSGTFLVGYLPMIVWSFCHNYIVDTPADTAFRFAVGLGQYANYLMDPIWYVLRFRECRYQLKLLLYTCKKDKQEDIMRSRTEHFATFSIEKYMR